MKTDIPYLRRQDNTAQLIVDGQPLILLAGELHNSSASSLEYLKPIWPRLAALRLNTVLAPLSWELIEPEEGRFDFHLLDGMVEQARAHGLHLVLLWFGTWKNSFSGYVPAWVKTDLARFPRAQLKPGLNAPVISPFGEEIRACDARAFAAVMRRIGEIDAGRQTVVMMQAENEVGLLGTTRDWSEPGQRAFADAVPEILLQALDLRRDALLPEVAEPWRRSGWRMAGTWPEVFGVDAPEIFMAWHLARHIEAVAAAGRQAYDLPVYVNAWLRQPGMEQAGHYPSGGPVSGMLDIWRAAAPHVDFLAPDIYLPTFKAVCAEYTRGGNFLFIPESWNDTRAATAAFYAIAQHQAIGFAPFAIDDLTPDNPLAETYAVLTEMMPLLTRISKDRMAGFFQESDDEQCQCLVGNYQLRLRATAPLQASEPPAGGMVIALDEPDTFLIVGRKLSVEFATPGAPAPNVEFLQVDAGEMQHGQWITTRRLNGDETGHHCVIRLGDHLEVQRVCINRAAVPIHFFHQIGPL